MRRRLFTFLSAVSLVLCVAACVLWVRSYWVGEVAWRETIGPAFRGVERRVWAVSHAAGSVKACRHVHVSASRPAVGTPGPGWSVHRSDPVEYDFTFFANQPGAVGGRWAWWGRHHRTHRDGLGGWHENRYSTAVVPHAAVAAAFLLGGTPALVAGWRARVRRRRARLALCPQCGYDLRATSDWCPECGAVPER